MATETTETMTIAQFIERNAISMKAVKIGGRPDSGPDQDRWDANASHWACTFSRRKRENEKGAAPTVEMTTLYSMGSAHTKPPKCDEVLDSLSLDSQAGRETFEGFCDLFGDDPDSRKAERTYRACVEIRARLLHFLGEHEYRHPLLDELHDCERL